MNSPADLYARYEGNEVAISEYDGCRDGHALLSDFGVESSFCFTTQIVEIGEGIGIGLYYGDGCFSDYLLVVVQKETISIRVPSKVPNGDTFRQKGGLRYYVLAETKYKIASLKEIGFSLENQQLIFYANGESVIEERMPVLPFEVSNKPPKLMVKAVNETGNCRKSDAVFGGYEINGIMKTDTLSLCCMDEATNQPWANGSIYLIGEYEKYMRTNERGEASLAGLPFGEYRASFGKEGGEFSIHTLLHYGDMQRVIVNDHNTSAKHSRENRPQERLKTNASTFSLNGLWNFELDEKEIGEFQEWYQPEKYSYKRCIRVPFSWQSLLAFGQEELAQEYTLHQANPWLGTAREVGEIGWYQRTISVSWEQETELVFAAVAGIGKVWLDGNLLGCIVDSYNQHVFSLGILEKDREYSLTVKVAYEHNSKTICNGKQGFWFTDAPGIWQNVWLRERQEAGIVELLVKYHQEEEKSLQKKEEKTLHKKDEKTPYQEAKSLHITAKAEIEFTGKKVITKGNGNHIMLSDCQNSMYQLSICYQTPFTSTISVLADGKVIVEDICIDAVSEYRGFAKSENSGCCTFDQVMLYIPLKESTESLSVISSEQAFSIIEMQLASVVIEDTVSLCWDHKLLLCAPMTWDRNFAKIIAEFTWSLEEWETWEPKHPHLYEIEAKIQKKDSCMVSRTLGIREIGVSPYSEEDGSYITLNQEKIYIRGVLDQGYNPWGIYTYPNLYGENKGSAEFDVKAALECGYNLLRMHIKDNEPDWYQLCDQYGVLVWDEIPCNFYGTAQDRHWQSMYQRQLRATVRKHNYHPCVILCSTINESWGISGDHEKSPWDDAKAQTLIKEYARYYKEHQPQALVIDNSGYGKSSETQVLDYHSYPGNFVEAHDFFPKLSACNYPKSIFNCYHKENQRLMQKEEVRSLLQRTCAQNLQTMKFVGEESQGGQPVLLSEFVHTDRQEEYIRTISKIAGYVRMNLASAENEDTSPYTSKRTKRDFGYVDRDLRPLSYEAVNAEDFLYLDQPFICKVYEEDALHIPVYSSLWSKICEEGENLQIRFYWNLNAEDGKHYKMQDKTVLDVMVVNQKPQFLGYFTGAIPKGYLGGYLFAEAYLQKENQLIKAAGTFVQFELYSKALKKCTTDRIQWNAADYDKKDGFIYSGSKQDGNRDLVWGIGKGTFTYYVKKPKNYSNSLRLVMEASACDCMEGTKVTDENGKESELLIHINGTPLEPQTIKPLSHDLRALYSNSSASENTTVDYCETGRFGYGSHITLTVAEAIWNGRQDLIKIEVEVLHGGLVLYGNRMGRYGNPPFFIRESKENDREVYYDSK